MTNLILGVVIVVLLFTLVSFSLASPPDSADNHDLPLAELSAIKWLIVFVFIGLMPLGAVMDILVKTLRLEFVRSHIGEKRPASVTIELNQFLSSARLAVTVLTYSAVIFVASALRFLAGSSSFLVYARGSSRRSRSKKSFNFI